MQHATPRSEGWTPSRQLDFLEKLARTRCVSTAAKSVGMSRESAYRLRGRSSSALFAAAWDRVMQGHRFVNFRTRRPSVPSLAARSIS
ncbi:MAG: hypothetical protein HOP96_04295 [Sphingomonas sp.]|nr:hypothetical protein [Sphingomonas sp.]